MSATIDRSFVPLTGTFTKNVVSPDEVENDLPETNLFAPSYTYTLAKSFVSPAPNLFTVSELTVPEPLNRTFKNSTPLAFFVMVMAPGLPGATMTDKGPDDGTGVEPGTLE